MPVFIHAAGGDSPHAGKVEVSGYLKIEKQQSILLADAAREAWLPKSEIKIVERYDDGRATVVMPPWLAADRGFVSAAVVAPLRNRTKFRATSRLKKRRF